MIADSHPMTVLWLVTSQACSISIVTPPWSMFETLLMAGEAHVTHSRYYGDVIKTFVKITPNHYSSTWPVSVCGVPIHSVNSVIVNVAHMHVMYVVLCTVV